MRPIRNVGGGNLVEKQRASDNLETLEGLWNEWEIHCLILVSFGLQVFLFFAAGMRRRSTSCILMSLLWLAYLSADSVAIFALGHLAVHASGPRHQLLFFWAPFLLLHLGGQDTITAFSREDNELWRRHLLGLVSQVTVAVYVVSTTPWPDRRLLAAMLLLLLSGCLKYAERTLCLYLPTPARIRELSLSEYRRTVHRLAHVEQDVNGAAGIRLKRRFDDMLRNGGRQPPAALDSEDTVILVYDTPLNDRDTIVGADALPGLLQVLKSSPDRCRAYGYVAARLVRIYECFYTKAMYRALSIIALRILALGDRRCYVRFPAIFAFLLFFPLVSTSTALALFMIVEKGQLYGRDDVIVSYILLIGAIVLEVASLFMSLLSDAASKESACATLTRLVSRVANCIHPAGQRGNKQWSEMLAQYSMIRRYTGQDATCLSFVPEWIGKHLDDKTLTHIPLTEDLKRFVLDKLLEFGTRDQQNWNFSSFRGQLALQKWVDSHEDTVSARPETPLHESINDVDVPTSVLIWHIATDICYFRDVNTVVTSSDQMRKQMSRELSNYIMYLVFKCGVMITNSTELLHSKALIEMKEVFEKQQQPKQVNLGEKVAINMVLQAHKDGHQPADTGKPTSSSSQLQVTQLQLLKNTMTALDSQLLPRACVVANELDGIRGDEHRWDLIAAVWLEMLSYIAPRCGGAFHSQHLSTGGEFITHVLLLMQLLGPFLPPPGGLASSQVMPIM